MTATVKINLNSPQAVSLLGYIETLPFAEVKRSRTAPKSTWQKAIDDGAVSVDEFIDELRRQVNEHYDGLENA